MKLRSLILFLLLPCLAHAGNPKNQAKKQAKTATLDFKLGRFQEALEGYSKAFELFPAPSLLFNIGQCQRNLKNHERAVFFFEGYLREQPTAANREVVLDLIREEKEEFAKAVAARVLEERRREEAERPRKQAERPREQEARGRVEDARQLPTPSMPSAVPAVALPPPSTLPTITAFSQLARTTPTKPARGPSLVGRWWFWPVVGGVAALATGGAIVYLSSEPAAVLPSGSLGTVDGR